MKKMRPPEGSQNAEYGGRVVPPEGIEVNDADIDSLVSAGWTIVDDREPTPLRRSTDNPQSEGK